MTPFDRGGVALGLGVEVAGRTIRPTGVIHAGGHHGEEAEAYRRHGVETVVWFEAEPDAFATLQRTVAGRPGHHCVRALLADTDGQRRPFYRHRFPGGEKRGFCSLLPFRGAAVRHDPVVSRLETFDVLDMPTTTVATALRQRGFRPAQFQYVSLNVQGAELMVLRGMGAYLASIEWVFCEAEASAQQSRYDGAPTLADVAEWLSAQGFRGAAPWTARHQLFFRR